ncbi:MAG: M48 family metalloprotease [Pararhodobacter sp.]|nr:M48 family metalloprotease [Pararhodobacter sp.]
MSAVFSRIPGIASLLLLATAALVACAPMTVAPPPRPAPAAVAGAPLGMPELAEVVTRMRPVANQVCRERSPHLDCNFIVVIDDRPGQPPNAFHTRDEAGRPIIGFTEALIRDMRSADEIALVFGHEAAHHIADHIPRIQREAFTGALIGGLLASVTRVDQATAQQLVDISATLRSRRYSQAFELEADRLGALIAHRAGFDPLRGADLFRRIPDPGNRFLATHPPNADRLREIERTMARIRAGQPV